MKIILDQLGKRYNQEWVFKKISIEFNSNHPVAILGANGSGKSTFLQVISGSVIPSSGKVTYISLGTGKEIEVGKIYSHVSLSAPYLELPEELTMKEVIQFHSQFKKFINELTISQVIEYSNNLKEAADKQIKNFSSGMKQRLKLLLAILSDTPLLLLDEPCSNLDKNGISWYHKLIKDFSANRIIIICSNHQKEEYDFCEKLINIEDYKK